jgi:hypothetical protein
MQGPSSRPFNLLDAIILVAATALGFAGMRLCREIGIPYAYAERPIFRGFYTVSPLLAAWTVAVPFLALRGPRPRLRRLARQPGLAACVSAALVIVAEIAFPFLRYLVAPPGWRVYSDRLHEILQIMARVIPAKNGYDYFFALLWVRIAGYAVAAAWIILALSGGSRSQPSWIDRLGRILGTFWIVGSVVAGLGL